jgi:putative ABC transport system permease protein
VAAIGLTLEGANDLRTLTATGAQRRVRRTLTATTAGALTLLGAAIGTAGAYLALIGALRTDLAMLGDVPVVNLLATTLGLPLLDTCERLVSSTTGCRRRRPAWTG